MTVQHTADPNILVPAVLGSIPVILAAVTGLLVTLRSNRRNRQATEKVHDAIRTNHGKRPGEYLEMIGPIADWAVQHTHDDNELRAALGLSRTAPPRFYPPPKEPVP